MQPADESTPHTSAVALSQRNVDALVLDGNPRIVEALVLQRAAFARGIVTAKCPQCGVNRADVPHALRVDHTPPWVYFTVLATPVALALCYFAARVRVTSSVMLCGDCVRAEKGARDTRSLALWAVLLVGGVGAVGLAVVASTMGTLIVGAAMVAACARARVVFARTNADLIRAGSIDAHNVTLKVRTSWRAVFRAEVPALLYGPGVAGERS